MKEVNSPLFAFSVQSSSLYLTKCMVLLHHIMQFQSKLSIVSLLSGQLSILCWSPGHHSPIMKLGVSPFYLITYKSDDSSTSRSVNTTSSSVAITGLNPQNVYIFTVQVSTGNGNNKGDTEYGEHVLSWILCQFSP